MHTISLAVLLLLCNLGFSQDIVYARYAIDSLTSPELHGRGYVSDGDELAARFIAGEYAKHGLKKFGKNYFQEFRTGVNTFPGDMALKVNGKMLVPGQDYLIDPCSCGFEGAFKVLYVDSTTFLDEDKLNKQIKK